VRTHRPSAATVSRTLLAILASGPLYDSSGLAIFLPLDPRVGPLVARPTAGLRRRVALDCR
jgi:hypothetical protein